MDHIIRAAQCVADIRTALCVRGIVIETGSDFARYNQIVSTTRGLEKVAPPFDHTNHYLDRDNSYWIVGRNADGAVIHTQAMKCLDLRGATLDGYLGRFYTEFSPAGLDIDTLASSVIPSPGAKRISGNLLYHGDIWLADGPLYRGTGLMRMLGLLVSALAYLKWSPDFIFGFVPEHLAHSGAGVRYIYAHNDPDVLQLVTTGGKEINGFMVWNAREDIEHALMRPLRG